jgi:Phytanoyl-CoA dioxygenase (PhyH)
MSAMATVLTATTKETRGDARAASGWTEEKRFLFDLRGWVCIPAVLAEAEIAACKAHIDRIQDAPETIEPIFQSRPGLSGPLQELLDHPAVAEILSDIINPEVDGEAYGFRCESNFIYRLRANPDRTGGHSHRGTRQAPGPHEYSYRDGRIYSGQTRVVWELNPVDERGGGTRFLTGSHKANLLVPESVQRDAALFDTYTCPAGSLLVFCERVLHSGATWSNRDWPRMSVFNCYNHHNCQVHKMNVTHEMVMAMPPKRRTLFRGAWEWWNRKEGGRLNNAYYSEENRSL